ncbi:hypothetical protein D9758_008220 [Tetrapyrgos nigripes]|uniref:DUF6535 domain-containing protein n=1 Tax=Tetrapyrgos nigripes TaxID=182062 RepID=A0A8H5G1I4_9AGAR|nr:hypothetical protein D9758_008220 [Tetrapyrgos nigripes]
MTMPAPNYGVFTSMKHGDTTSSCFTDGSEIWMGYCYSLTAFLIESYKTLRNDPTQDAVVLLTQISQQLAAASNSTVTTFQPVAAFQPPTSAILCNILWFLSLALALTCSLPSPIRQARVIAFIYAGVRDCGMHAFVDLIPILLHLSLLFFVGLVNFLLPVNRLLTYVMACVLVIFLVTYVALTCAPLLYLNAPYRTPLSSALWRLGNVFGDFLSRGHREQTLTEAMLAQSWQDTADRDKQAVLYTVKSLTDKKELLPFLESIPDVIYDTHRSWDPIRVTNVHLIIPLLETSDPEVNILSRITQFIRTSDVSGDSVFHERGRLACSRALWSLAYLLVPDSASEAEASSLDDEYVLPALVTMRLSWLYAIHDALDMVEDLLVSPSPRVDVDGLRMRFVSARKVWDGIELPPSVMTLGHELEAELLVRALRAGSVGQEPSVQLKIVGSIVSRFRNIWQVMRLNVLSGYLSRSFSLISVGKRPHEFGKLCQAICPVDDSISDTGLGGIHYAGPLMDMTRLLNDHNSVSDLEHEYIIQCIRLFTSSKEALSNAPAAVTGRRRVLQYFCHTAESELRGVEHHDKFAHRQMHSSRYDIDYTSFPLRVWKALHIPSSARYTVLTSEKLDGRDRFQAHGSFFRNIFLFASLVQEESYKDSLWITLLSQWINLMSQDDVPRSFTSWYHRSGQSLVEVKNVDKTAQIAFAQNFSHLIDAIINSNAGPGHYLWGCFSAVCFQFFVWNELSTASCPSHHNWNWITSHRGAKILVDAIRRFEDFRPLAPGIRKFEGQDELYRRCRIVLLRHVARVQKRVVREKKRCMLFTTLHGRLTVTSKYLLWERKAEGITYYLSLLTNRGHSTSHLTPDVGRTPDPVAIFRLVVP